MRLTLHLKKHHDTLKILKKSATATMENYGEKIFTDQ